MVKPARGFFVLLLFVGLGIPVSRMGVGDDTIHFYYDYATALKKAKATGRPIFLEFRCAP